MIIHLLNTRARITEVDDASDQIINLYDKTSEIQGDQVLKGIMETIRKQSDEITKAIKRSKAESDVEEIDNERDNALRSLNNVINGYKSMPNEDWAKSGAKLANVFNKYGLEIIKESYSSESSHIESMLLDFSDSSLQQDIDKLAGMRECINNLRMAQNRFNMARQKLNEANAEAKLLDSATNIKRELLNNINSLFISYVKVIVRTNDKNFINFALKLDDIITKINISISMRYDNRPDAGPIDEEDE